jgi:hypothetical protein
MPLKLNKNIEIEYSNRMQSEDMKENGVLIVHVTQDGKRYRKVVKLNPNSENISEKHQWSSYERRP